MSRHGDLTASICPHFASPSPTYFAQTSGRGRNVGIILLPASGAALAVAGIAILLRPNSRRPSCERDSNVPLRFSTLQLCRDLMVAKTGTSCGFRAGSCVLLPDRILSHCHGKGRSSPVQRTYTDADFGLGTVGIPEDSPALNEFVDLVGRVAGSSIGPKLLT